MARPKLKTAVHCYQTTFRLREGEDDDLIAFFSRIPSRQVARTIMTALRQGGVEQVTAALDEEDETWEADFAEMLY